MDRTWIARESTLRGKWEYPGSSGANGLVIVSRLAPSGGGEGDGRPRDGKTMPPGPGNRFQLAKLPRPRTFLRVPFNIERASGGPPIGPPPPPAFCLLSFVDFNWQNSRNAWTTVLVTAARRRPRHPPNRREIETQGPTVPKTPLPRSLPAEFHVLSTRSSCSRNNEGYVASVSRMCLTAVTWWVTSFWEGKRKNYSIVLYKIKETTPKWLPSSAKEPRLT